MMSDIYNISELREVVHVWYCSFSENESNLSEFKRLLSEEEKVRASSFKFKKDENCYIISRGILRELLGSYLNKSPKAIAFEYTVFGKPFLATGELNFNISHSGNMAVFAFVIGYEIGVDIENIREDFNVLEIAKNFFSTKEVEALKKLPRTQLIRAFYRCWTRKESFIKAEGSGLSFPLNQFTVSIDNDNEARLLKTDWDRNEKSNWSLFSFAPKEQYMIALALKQPVFTVKYFNCANFL